MGSRLLGACLAMTCSAILADAAPCAAQQLGSYAVREDRIFVAGISSGGYMAVQMHVAFSRLFKGAAIYAGGPYYCAQDNLLVALTTCLSDVPPVNLQTLESTTAAWAKQRLIDPVDNLKGQPVYLWSGVADTTVRQPVMDALKSYYQYFAADIVRYDNDFDAEHGWESPYGPLPCQVAATPYIITCTNADRVAAANVSDMPPDDRGGAPTAPYDSEKVWLANWFGHLKSKNEGKLNGSVIPFDQNEFAPGGNAAAISMDSTGYAFVPADCASGRECGLILALHGCLQYYGAVGPAFIDDAGINQWADTNRIIVLYPQTIPTGGSNPQGCWDWWGYLNDPNYAQKSGPQMQALSAMVMHAAGLRSQR